MNRAVRSFGFALLAILVLGAAGWLLQAGSGQEKASSRAYVGHESDVDMAGFIRQYSGAAGTRLDDCQTCHRGGVEGTDTEREYSPCSYCHLIVFPNARYKTGVPEDYEATLNGYGLAYKKAGRAFEAFAAVAGLDSDADGHRNGAEIADLRNPGRSGQPARPAPRADDELRLGRDPQAPRPQPVHADEQDDPAARRIRDL